MSLRKLRMSENVACSASSVRTMVRLQLYAMIFEAHHAVKCGKGYSSGYQTHAS